MKIFNENRKDWDVHIPFFLWEYRTTCTNSTRQTPFRLVYRQEVVMPMEYIVPILRIYVVIEMEEWDIMEERLMQILELEEDRFLVVFHQQVQSVA